MFNVNDILNFLDIHSGGIGALSLIMAGFWALWKFRDYLKDKRFNIYHKLIDELVNEQLQPDRKIKLDRQIAIIYELRNFSAYYPVSKRILIGLKSQEGWMGNKRIIEEIDLALFFMGKSWPQRLWTNFRKSY